MTETEEADLRALGNDLAGALQSDWQPGCICRAFATPTAPAIVLTMQGWIDLDAARSALLLGGLPESWEELAAACAIFGLSLDGLSVEEGTDLAHALRRACDNAFATALKMREPDVEGASVDPSDGFGSWIPLLCCLLTQCGFTRVDALICPVDQAFAIIAGTRRNQGWEVAGTPYALRDLEEVRNG